jgi:hypothetical protein
MLTLVGHLWRGQRDGIIGGSAMSGSSLWAVVGVVSLAPEAVVPERDARRGPT